MGGARRLTRADIERARSQLGLQGGVQQAEFGFQRPVSLGGVQSAEEPASQGSGVGGFLGALGDAFGFIDEPISNRLGVNLPGPLDFVLEELTRPTTLGIALGGAGLAPRVAGLGFRGAGLAANLIAPAGGTGFGSRLAAEAAIGLGARGAAEGIQRVLPEETPTPARLALGLGAGIIGGGAALGATRAGVRRAVGEDILRPLPTLRPTEVETGVRKGHFLNVRTEEQLPESFDVGDVLRVAREAENSGINASEILTSRAVRITERLGTATRDQSGNLTLPGVRRLRADDTAPAYLQEVLEFGPSRFALTDDQADAVRAFQDFYTGDTGSLRAERAIFEIDPEEAPLMEGQRFISRFVVKEPGGGTAGGGGRRLSGFTERSRQFKDPRRAIESGIVYDHPAQALDAYARQTFDAAANEHVARLLRAVGQRPLDRVHTELGGVVANIRQKLAGRRLTRERQVARAGILDDEAARRGREAQQAAEREFVSAGTLDELRLRQLPPEDIADLQRLARGAVTDAQSLGVRIGRSRRVARELGLKLTKAERELGKEATELLRLASKLDETLTGTEGVLRSQALTEESLRAGTKESTARLRQQNLLIRRMGQTERRMARLSEQSRNLDDRIEAELLKGATAEEIGGQARVQLEEAMRGEREALRINQRVRAAEVELKAGKAEARRGVSRSEAAAGRARRAETTLETTEETIETLESQLATARAKWERAKEAAARIPEGRARVDLSVAPKLVGVDFPARDAQRIADWYGRGKPPPGQQLRGVRTGIRNVNRFMIPLRATADASSTLNQLGAFAVNNPKRFVRNFGHAVRDAVGFENYDRYLDEVGEDAARHQVAILGRGRRATSDFEFENWFERVPVLRTILSPAQRHFQAFTTRMRVDTFNDIRDAHLATGAPLDDTALDQVGRALNRLSGISNSKAGDVETMLEFAPNFLRSTMEVFWTAGTSGNIEGQLARQYMRNLVAFTAVLSASVAVAQGRDVREVLSPFSESGLRRGEIRLNPNFLSVRVPLVDQDVALLGRFDSFARLVVLAGDTGRGVISERSVGPLVEAIDFVARTKGAPTISTGIAAFSGHTFTGQPFPSPQAVATEVLPFTFSAFVEDMELGLIPAGGGGLFSSLGAKSNPITPFERLQEGSAVMFNKPLDELTGQERQQLDEAFPRISEQFRKQTEGFARQGDAKAKARLRTDEIDQERLARETAIVAALQAGDFSLRDFGEALNDAQQEAAIKKREARTTLGVEFDDASQDAARALSAWYDLYEQAEFPGTGQVDFERRDELEAALFKLIDDGEFGDPIAARRAIEERRRPEHAEPLVQQYFADKDQVGESGYYDVRDNEFARFLPLAQRIDPDVSSYGQLLRAINRADVAGEALQARRLRAVQNRIDSRVSQLRLRMRITSPELDTALLRLGRVTTPARARA